MWQMYGEKERESTRGVLLSIKNVQKRQRNLSRLISMKILIFMGGKVRAVSGRD